MKLKIDSQLYFKLLLGSLFFLLVVIAATAYYFYGQTQTIFAELQGARNLVTIQNDRSDLLEGRLMALEQELAGTKNCNFTTEQALQWEKSQELAIFLVVGPLASNRTVVHIRIPKQWCYDESRELISISMRRNIS